MAVGSAGNASLRLPSGLGGLVLITPMGRPLDRLTPEELPLIDMEGDPVQESLPPSSETLLHLATYRARPEVGAVVHTHPVFAGVLAVAARPLPPVLDEMVIKLGGPVSVADYAFPGTEELAAAAVLALGDRMAVLLRNHGLITAGLTLDDAVENSLLTERASQIFVYTALLKEANPLPDDIVQMERELYKMRISAKLSNQEGHGHRT